MPDPLVECVPNFSEGRDEARITALVRSIEKFPGVRVLDRTSDVDHHRSVITFAGPPVAVRNAAVAAVVTAAELIDLRQHRGVHPRLGAADVVPFVPVHGITLDECATLAHEAGDLIWQQAGVPVYFYEAAARTPERRNLEDVRRGGFEEINLTARPPDVGGPALHPTAGATVVGARPFLIA